MQINRRKLSQNENAILLSEVESICPLCTKALMYEKNGRREKLFEGAHIYPLNPSAEEDELLKNEERLGEDVNHLDNFIALCRDCHKKFDNPRTIDEYRKLVEIKKKLITRTKTKSMYFEYQIEIEIKQILRTLIEEFNVSSETVLRMEALILDDKADETLDNLTKNRIRRDITDYYLYIQEQFRQLDKESPNSFNIISSQIKTFYLKLSKTETSQEVIYDHLTEWLSKKTENGSLNACGIIISFFIQNCEVF